MRDSRQKILLQSFMLGAEQRGLGSAPLTALKCFDRRDLELVECVRIRFDLSQRIDLGLRQRLRLSSVRCSSTATRSSMALRDDMMKAAPDKAVKTTVTP